MFLNLWGKHQVKYWIYVSFDWTGGGQHFETNGGMLPKNITEHCKT
jgi:hypothetical protein